MARGTFAVVVSADVPHAARFATELALLVGAFSPPGYEVESWSMGDVPISEVEADLFQVV